MARRQILPPSNLNERKAKDPSSAAFPPNPRPRQGTYSPSFAAEWFLLRGPKRRVRMVSQSREFPVGGVGVKGSIASRLDRPQVSKSSGVSASGFVSSSRCVQLRRPAGCVAGGSSSSHVASVSRSTASPRALLLRCLSEARSASVAEKVSRLAMRWTGSRRSKRSSSCVSLSRSRVSPVASAFELEARPTGMRLH
jgi:hypothetical protein